VSVIDDEISFTIACNMNLYYAAIDRQKLQRVWRELDYRIDIFRVTKGGYIEHL